LQALGAFMHNLFAALQAQGGPAAQGGQPPVQGGGDSSGSSGVAGASGSHHHHGGGLAQIESSRGCPEFCVNGILLNALSSVLRTG
jgi:hypothetical protein